MKYSIDNSALSGSLNVSRPDAVRIGPVLAIPAVLAEFDVMPQRAFSLARVDYRLFQNPDSRISFEALGRLFESCVNLTKCNHFGLLVGDRFNLKGLGALGYLMSNSATVGDALHNLLLHLRMHDRGATPILLRPDPALALLGYSIYRHNMPATVQIYDAAITIGHKILKEICGTSWKSVRVQFSHSPPGDIRPYRRLFGTSVIFNAAVSGIAFSSDWLQIPVDGADNTVHSMIVKAVLEAESNNPQSFSEQVKIVLHQLVLSGNASANSIAEQFGVSERTLRRRLEKEGKNLMQLVNSVRFELSQQLLQDTDLSVSEIATALQYSDPNIFSRAFRIWSTLSPTQWRALQQRRNQHFEE
jgi:AraC-like DNA-binding protein